MRSSRAPTAAAVTLALAAATLSAGPARAFEYTVEGSQPQTVVVHDELLTASASAVAVGYLMPLVMGGLFFVSSHTSDRAPAQHNAAIGLALSTPPVVNGALLAMHLLDEENAYDSPEGWAALPAIAAWGFTAAQVVGLGLLAGAFLFAERRAPAVE